MGSLCWLLAQNLLQLWLIPYEREKKKARNSGRGRKLEEHTQRASVTQEMLAKTQTGWDTETERDKSL